MRGPGSAGATGLRRGPRPDPGEVGPAAAGAGEARGLGRGTGPEWRVAGGREAARGRFDPGGGGPVFCQFVMRIGLLVLT
ncbi:hypothetical protein GCM10010376_12750 [Streptomyces violaceusniger]